jgi:hypothetical protein
MNYPHQAVASQGECGKEEGSKVRLAISLPFRARQGYGNFFILTFMAIKNYLQQSE